MTTHTDLVSALATDLVTAGVVAAAAEVYDGRRSRRVTSARTEVWLERLADEELGGGFQRQVKHVYLVHVVVAPRNAGPDGTGQAQLRSAEQHGPTLVARWGGEPPAGLIAALSGTFVSSMCSEEELDEDPLETKQQSFSLRLEIVEAL